jgi:hypothetical protein
MDITNASFASPLAEATYARIVGNPQIGSVLTTLSELNGWTIALTIFLILVAYDQCKWQRQHFACSHQACSPHLQSATFGTRVQLLARHGKPPL